MKNKIAIIGLGYVGLPLAIEFSKKFEVIGFDIDKLKISDLKKNIDKTKEVNRKDLKNSSIIFTSKISNILSCNIFIITVPTPLYKINKPDFRNLIDATHTIGKILKKDDIVIYESTVYPGATREKCIPILEKNSKLKLNIDFGVGYSPERINPGDKSKRINKVIKIVSGSNDKYSKFIKKLYCEIIDAGVYLTSSIEIAEAAKIIENIQRDVNIALFNEFSKIFKKMSINSNEVFSAASTKWNFIKFEPGLVGGHCISVDPYYLTERSLKLNYKPEMILSGRKINNSMPSYIANVFYQIYLEKKIKITKPRILILGLTFKENCPDIRNSKVFNLIYSLKKFNFNLDVYDPYIKKNDIAIDSKYTILDKIKKKNYVGVIIAVKHSQFVKLKLNFVKSLCIKNSLIFDLKSIYDYKKVDFQL